MQKLLKKMLKTLRPAIYNYTEQGQQLTNLNGKKSFGFIAQDLEKLFPQSEYNIVVEDENGYKQVNYNQIVALLYKIILIQNEQIEVLSKEISEIKNKVDMHASPYFVPYQSM